MFVFIANSTTIAAIRKVMEACETTRTSPFSTCLCPALLMQAYGLTQQQLTLVMAQEQPTTWTDPRQYCGTASLNCAAPNCITLPR